MNLENSKSFGNNIDTDNSLKKCADFWTRLDREKTVKRSYVKVKSMLSKVFNSDINENVKSKQY